MGISAQPSKLSLPQTNPGVTTVLEYLIIKFSFIDRQVWQQRMTDGKVHFHDGSLITPDTPFQPQQRVYYYREVSREPTIPFKEAVIFQDQEIVVAYKPHFLATTPGGIYVDECLQNRLRRSTGITALQALHRLDRATAGLVMFSVNPDTRHLYHHLFETRQIHKTYQAIANIGEGDQLVGRAWEVRNRIASDATKAGEPHFRMRMTEGEANSHSVIRCLQQTNKQALFELNPVTGKTHQLRLHMQSLGMPILNDQYYPRLQPQQSDDYAAPLQLLAKALQFRDPISQQQRHFDCARHLSLI